MALGDVIARLAVSLSLDSSSFTKGSKKTQAEAETLGKKMTKIAGVIGTAFVASIGVDTVRAWADATKGALEFAGSLGETAQQIGATTDELQEYRYVASQVGIEQATMDKGLAKLSVTLGNLKAGVGSTAKKLEEFGFTQAEITRISTLTAGEALPFLAGKYAALESPTQKAALAAVFFGSKMGGNFIPLLNEGAAGLQKMRDAAHDLGIVISEEAIKNADANADLLSTYEQIATAQKNAALTVPANVKAYVEYEKTITNLQVAFYKAIAGVNEFNEKTKTWDQSLRDFGKNSGIHQFFLDFDDGARRFGKAAHDLIVSVPAMIGRMVTAIGGLIGTELGKVWDRAMLKIKMVATAFNWLYDVVIGHSYIPDMVDGIAAQMARLDTVMVAQAGKATTATAKKFQELRDLLDRLFPDVVTHNRFAADMAGLGIPMSGALDPQKAEQWVRLQRELAGVDVVQGAGKTGPDFGDVGSLTDGMDDVGDALGRLAEKAKINTVKIADSFKDMAEKTMASLSRLSSAIKGGGFLGILEAVIGVGLQLGSVGAFGKTIAGRLNKVPGYAGGTNFHPGGLAMVGERGPELVSMPRGSRVTPNHAMGGMGGVMEIRPSPLFEVYVDGKLVQAAPSIAQAGVALAQHHASRRWR